MREYARKAVAIIAVSIAGIVGLCSAQDCASVRVQSPVVIEDDLQRWNRELATCRKHRAAMGMDCKCGVDL